MFFSFFYFFFFKQKTAYEMVMSDWSSDVCSSDLAHVERQPHHQAAGGVGGEQRGQGLEIAPAAHAADDPQPLCRDAELVAHRHADPGLAHVEGRDPHASRLTPAPRGRNATAGRRARPASVDKLKRLCEVADPVERASPRLSRRTARPDRRRADIVPGRRMLGTPRKLAALACAMALLEPALGGAGTHRRP